jgi:beta-lactamase superfamily II metal-dependent hydrolase
MFSIEMLPARQGDCLWIEYGAEASPNIILVDGGMTQTAAAIRKRIKDRSGGKTLSIELIVVTHIDNDHILGILDLLQDPDLPLEIGDVWFNGRPQLEKAFPRPDLLGTAQGDALSKLLEQRKLTWNGKFGGKLVDAGKDKPQQFKLAGGMTLTVVGPPTSRLKALADAWVNLKGGTDAGDSDVLGERDDILGRKDVWPAKWAESNKLDDAVANGSSIALVADFDGKRALLTGDAFAPDLVAGLKKYRKHFAPAETGRLSFAAVKLSHHGSAKNISKDLLDAVDCVNFLVSTDGTQHKHPDTQALLRVIRWCGQTPTFHFNYRSDRTKWWIERGRELEREFQRYGKVSPEIERNGWLKFDL